MTTTPKKRNLRLRGGGEKERMGVLIREEEEEEEGGNDLLFLVMSPSSRTQKNIGTKTRTEKLLNSFLRFCDAKFSVVLSCISTGRLY